MKATKGRRDEATKGRARLHSAFTFTEVMFAVILLGVGFIMVAALFPVAISQSQASIDDAMGVNVVTQGGQIMSQSGGLFATHTATGYTYQIAIDKVGQPPDGTIPAQWFPMVTAPGLRTFFDKGGDPNPPNPVLTAAPFDRIKGNLISATDPRFAWIPVAYQCSASWNYMKVYILAVKAQHESAFTPNDLNSGLFKPTQVHFYLTEGGNGAADLLSFTDPNSNSFTPYEEPRAGQGAFVWVQSDQMTGTVNINANSPVQAGAANGRMYRLSAKRDDLGPGIWELQSGYDMSFELRPGTDGKMGTADDQEVNENLPPRLMSQTSPTMSPAPVPASGLIVGRAILSGLPEGAPMDVYALPAIIVPFSQ